MASPRDRSLPLADAQCGGGSAAILAGMREQDPYDSPVGRFYASYIARPRVAQVVGRVLWRSDFRPMYRSLRRLSQIPPESNVLDVACGAGLALHWLDPSVHYVGIDASDSMIERARRTSRRRGFVDADMRSGNAESMPLPDGAVDVALLYNALHCVGEPTQVLHEAVRCLAPRGTLVGTMLLRGESPRVDRLMDRDRDSKMMGRGGTRDQLAAWLAAELINVRVDVHGALAVFEGVAPAA